MTPEDLYLRLSDAIVLPYFTVELYEIVAELPPPTPSLVREIFRLMELHPEQDFGAPGELTRYIEALPGYEFELFESVRRRATFHTSWMLDRARRNPHRVVPIPTDLSGA